MLEKLLALLLHAKGGAVSAVFVLGATGALVTATTTNGVTTITLTEASPTASASLTASASPTATTSPTASLNLLPSSSSSSLTSSASPSPCADEAHRRNEAVRKVDGTYSQYHSQLERMHKSVRTDALRKAVDDADRTIKGIRAAAVKAIHMTAVCAKDKHDDEDENEDEDEDGENEEHHASSSTTSTASPTASPAPTITFNTTDPNAIAQLAVAAMKDAFEKAKTAVGPLASPTPRTRHEEQRHDGGDQRHDNKGRHD